MQRGSHRAVEPVLKVSGAPPLNNVRKEITKERRVLGQQRSQIQGALGSHQFIQADLHWRYGCPVFGRDVAMVRVRARIADRFEDHLNSLGNFFRYVARFRQ